MHVLNIVNIMNGRVLTKEEGTTIKAAVGELNGPHCIPFNEDDVLKHKCLVYSIREVDCTVIIET